MGYCLDPWHIAFVLSSSISTDESSRDRKADLSLFLAADVLLTIDIIFKLITAYQVDDQLVTDIWKVMWNYIKGTFVFDCAASIPGFFLDGNTNWHFLKMFRIVHVRRVFSDITDYNKALLTRCNLDKTTVEKTCYIGDLIIYSFTGIHTLGCAWIYFG